MVQFEYKVVQIACTENYGLGHLSGDSVESAINAYAKDGWEYQNAIVYPTIETDNTRYFTRCNLVFRRAKS